MWYLTKPLLNNKVTNVFMQSFIPDILLSTPVCHSIQPEGCNES